MRRFSFQWSWSTFIALLLTLFSVAACSLGGSSGVKDDMKLKVAIDPLGAAFLPDYVALDKGYSRPRG
jgi:hypothetical protein